MMNCERTHELLGTHLDRELDAANDRELQDHLRGCPECLRAAEQAQQLQKLVRAAVPYHRAPAGLEMRIRGALRGTVTTAPAPRRSNPRTWFTSLSAPWQSAGAMAVVAAMLIAVWAGSVISSRRAATEFLGEEIVNAHVRSLLGEHLTDVLSSDQHTVKPWFDGKVDFAPPVRDFRAEGFPLVGGRLDYVAGHPVAALVFQRNKHFINVFVWPATAGGALSAPEPTVRGYNIISWRQQDLAFCAISDLNSQELRELTELIKAK